MRVNPTAATAFLTHEIATWSSGARTYFVRFYLYITTSTNAIDSIFQIRDGTNAVFASLRLNTNRTLELWDDPFNVQIGSDSPVLSTGQWYRIEMSFDISSGGATNSHTARVDGVQFATGGSGTPLTSGTFDIRLGAVSSTNCDIYFDDVAINDSTGSVQNSFPGAGSVVYMRPDGVGDNTQWQDDASSSQGTSMLANISEVTPDDATNYNKRTTNTPATTPIDDWAVGSAASAGIGPSDTVTLVQVGVRAGATSATWPAPGSEDTELGVIVEPEVFYGTQALCARVQA